MPKQEGSNTNPEDELKNKLDSIPQEVKDLLEVMNLKSDKVIEIEKLHSVIKDWKVRGLSEISSDEEIRDFLNTLAFFGEFDKAKTESERIEIIRILLKANVGKKKEIKKMALEGTSFSGKTTISK